MSAQPREKKPYSHRKYWNRRKMQALLRCYINIFYKYVCIVHSWKRAPFFDALKMLPFSLFPSPEKKRERTNHGCKKNIATNYLDKVKKTQNKYERRRKSELKPQCNAKMVNEHWFILCTVKYRILGTVSGNHFMLQWHILKPDKRCSDRQTDMSENATKKKHIEIWKTAEYSNAFVSYFVECNMLSLESREMFIAFLAKFSAQVVRSSSHRYSHESYSTSSVRCE